jgi:hypothetical protein
MQEIMLFHACRGSSENQSNQIEHDVLFNQTYFRLIGELNPAFFKLAWQTIIDRHPALRTAFVWEGLKKPQQIVRTKLDIPYSFVDLKNISVEEQKTKLTDICQKDRQLGFQPTNAPLMRVKLIAMNNKTHQLIWSSHHLAIDRWSIPVIFDELFSFYQQLLDGQQIVNKKAPSFKAYIGWLKNINENEEKTYWLKKLSGFKQKTFLTHRKQNIDQWQQKATQPIDTEELGKLKAFCKKHKITMANLMQGAWALVLNQHNNASDVMFGVVVSGRPPQLNGVEGIIGSFVNNLPVRVKFSQKVTAVTWLQNLQKEAYARGPYEHVPVTTLQTWSDLPHQQSLFDSILVWLAPSKIRQLDQLEVAALPSEMSTNYPLTLSVEETKTAINLFAKLNKNSQCVVSLSDILSQLKARIMSIADAKEDTFLSDFPGITCQDSSTEEDLKNFINNQNVLVDTSPNIKNTLGRAETKLDWVTDYLTSEWKRLLDIETIGLDDDFFALGGTSIKAAQLLASVENAERKKIPILSLFNQPTILGMAKTIIGQKWPLNPQIVTTLNKNGTKTPLFCIASPDVNTLGYANLSNELGDDFPLYVIQTLPEVDSIRQLVPSDIPRIASTYIKAMKETQPEGPYQLFGMCGGAYFAFEMGRQLEAKGEQCKFIGIANSWAFYTVSERFKYQIVEDNFRRNVNYYQDRFKTLDIDEAIYLIKKKFLKTFGIIIKKRGPITSHSNQPTTGTETTPTTEPDKGLAYALFKEVGWEHLEPKIHKTSQKITVFRINKQPYWRVRMECLGWTKHAKSVEVVNIKGKNLREILRQPYIIDLSKKVQRRLL